jgi:hypothetical protein
VFSDGGMNNNLASNITFHIPHDADMGLYEEFFESLGLDMDDMLDEGKLIVLAATYTVAEGVVKNGRVRENGNETWTAIANQYFKFRNWTDETGKVISTKNPLTEDDILAADGVTGDITPNFYLPVCRVTVEVVGGGEVRKTGVRVDANRFVWGTQVRLEAVGGNFSHWKSGDRIVSTDRVYRFHILMNQEFIAVFEN